VNRAQVTDFANDLQPRFGVERFTTHVIGNVQGETGPNGETIWKPVNDIHDACRFGGSWTNSTIDTNGNRPITTFPGSFVEIVFLGTGLDLLILTNSGSTPPDLRVSVDGGAEGGNIWISGALNPNAGRNFSTNQPLTIVSGLAYGMHTVKIRQINTSTWSWGVYGYDVLNESTTSLRTSPGVAYSGGKELRLAATGTQSYNSGFVSGTLGSRGGRVLVYLQDGVLKKAVQPTDVAQANFSSANHTNEEMIRKYNFREFGSARSDDFSYQSGSAQSDRVFTLDDGTTTLVGQNCTADQVRGGEDNVWVTGGSNRFLMITFVGTGLDIVASSTSDGSPRTFTSVLVDGVNIGGFTTSVINYTHFKIVSGLPYGTHTVKFVGDGGGASPGIKDFLVYVPKKPTLPSDAVEVADYNLMATFVANATASVEAIATGVLRKSARRELNYHVGAWVSGLDAAGGVAGVENNINTVGAKFTHTFFGTGFDLRFSVGTNRSSSVQININGNNATTGNFPTLVSSVVGGAAFNTGTGVMNQNNTSAAGGVRISGLPLGKYTVEFINGTTNFIVVGAIDVITPVHTYKENIGLNIQGCLDIGSCAIGSTGRKIYEQYPVQASSIAIATINDPSTAITALGPIPDMTCNIKTKGRPILITYSTVFRHSAAVTSGYAQIFVDGRRVGAVQFYSSPATNYSQTLSGQYIALVGAGNHTVQVMYTTDSGTLFAVGFNREMTVTELT